MTIHRKFEHTLININNMKFQPLFRVCLIFYTYDSMNFKKYRNNTMKKMLLATALALLITGCAQQTFTVQNKPAAGNAKGNHFHPSFSSFLELGRRNCRCSQNLQAQKNVVRTENQQTFVNGLLGFYYYLKISIRWKRVHCSHRPSCPSIWATLSALLINIISGFLPVVFA